MVYITFCFHTLSPYKVKANILASNTWTSNDRKVMVIDELNFKISDKHILTSHKMKSKCLFSVHA